MCAAKWQPTRQVILKIEKKKCLVPVFAATLVGFIGSLVHLLEVLLPPAAQLTAHILQIMTVRIPKDKAPPFCSRCP
jgi:hypothetical protein